MSSLMKIAIATKRKTMGNDRIIYISNKHEKKVLAGVIDVIGIGLVPLPTGIINCGFIKKY